MSETSKTTPSALGDATTFSALSEGVVAEWRAAMEGVTPGPWVYINPVEFDGDDENESGGFIHPGGVEGDDGNPVCAFGDPSGSGTMFENAADHHWLTRCSPSGISGLLALIESLRATIEQQRIALIEADATLTSEDACNIEPIVGSHNPHENAAGLVRQALSRSSTEVKNDD